MNQKAKKILITGIAGFIGFHLARYLKERGDRVIGLDNFNSYYDPNLKNLRKNLLEEESIEIVLQDVRNQKQLEKIIEEHQITHFVHLAAQAGVRHSFQNPEDYIESNLNGFSTVLEVCRSYPNMKLTYASSSSVYGMNKKTPFSETDRTDSPANLYGATKKANEVMAQAYHNLYGISSTGLRYFTVFGPWGRPDMAYFLFTKAILEEKPIRVFNHGRMCRDFTYIDDIVKGTAAAIDLESPCEIFNLGNHRPIGLMELIETLENTLNKKAIKEMVSLQPGEAIETFADIRKSEKFLRYQPKVAFEEGIAKFVDWFKEFYLPHFAVA